MAKEKKLGSCPSCGSKKIKEFNTGRGAVFIGFIIFIAGAIFGGDWFIYIGIGLASGGLIRILVKIKKPADMICLDCNHRWKAETGSNSKKVKKT